MTQHAGCLNSHKGSLAGRRTTWIRLTDVGRAVVREHVAAVRALIDLAD